MSRTSLLVWVFLSCAFGVAHSAKAQCGACPFPCSNGGTCVNDDCVCPPGFGGDCCGTLIICAPGCLSCTETECLQCDAGYDLVNGDCIPMFAACCISCDCVDTTPADCTALGGIDGPLGSTCQLTICLDNVDPVITCPPDIELCEEGADTGSATATDDCNPDPLIVILDDPTICLFVPGSDPNEGDPDGECYGCTQRYIERTFTANDGSGGADSCTQIIRIGDHRPPIFETDPGLIAECYPTLTEARNEACAAALEAAADNCSTELTCDTTYDPPAGNCDLLIAATVTDECGLHSTPAFFATSVDGNAPTATCNATDAPYVVDENCETYVNFTGQIQDDCCLDVSTLSVTPSLQSGGATIEFDQTTDCVVNPTGDSMLQISCNIEVSKITECPAVVLITLNMDDCCGNSLSPACTDTAIVVDETPPVVECPAEVTLDHGSVLCNETEEFFNNIVATDNCAGSVEVTDNVQCGLPFNSTTDVTFSATDDCGNVGECTTAITIGPGPRLDISKKGSLLAFSKVDLRWNAAGELTQDTFLALTNDYPEEVFVQMYFVNGDAALDPLFSNTQPPVLLAEGEPGWNWVDCQVLLTPDQPVHWSAATGSPLGCQPFAILDPDLGSGLGRPNPEVADGSRMLRGFVIAFAVNEAGAEIQWNHLSGKITIVDYANTTAWEYDAFAFQAPCGVQGEEPLDCTEFDIQGVCCEGEAFAGALAIDGFQYDYAFGALLLDFFGVGSQALSGPSTPVTTDTDLTLHILAADLRQETEGPVTTKAHFDIWNMNERKLSNTRRCLTCWDQTLLSQYNAPNSFLRENLQSDKGKARIEGLRANECEANCLRDERGEPLPIGDVIDLLGELFNPVDFVCSQDAALLGLAAKYLAFSGPAGQRAVAGSNLVGMGTEQALIQYDVVGPPGTLRLDAYDRIGRNASRGAERLQQPAPKSSPSR